MLTTTVRESTTWTTGTSRTSRTTQHADIIGFGYLETESPILSPGAQESAVTGDFYLGDQHSSADPSHNRDFYSRGAQFFFQIPVEHINSTQRRRSLVRCRISLVAWVTRRRRNCQRDRQPEPPMLDPEIQRRRFRRRRAKQSVPDTGDHSVLNREDRLRWTFYNSDPFRNGPRCPHTPSPPERNRF